jgi:hypothetical protein
VPTPSARLKNSPLDGYRVQLERVRNANKKRIHRPSLTPLSSAREQPRAARSPSFPRRSRGRSVQSGQLPRSPGPGKASSTLCSSRPEAMARTIPSTRTRTSRIWWPSADQHHERIPRDGRRVGDRLDGQSRRPSHCPRQKTVSKDGETLTMTIDGTSQVRVYDRL